MSEHKPLPRFKTFLIPYDRHGNPWIGDKGYSLEGTGPSEELTNPVQLLPWGFRGLVWSKVMADEPITA